MHSCKTLYFVIHVFTIYTNIQNYHVKYRGDCPIMRTEGDFSQPVQVLVYNNHIVSSADINKPNRSAITTVLL